MLIRVYPGLAVAAAGLSCVLAGRRE